MAGEKKLMSSTKLSEVTLKRLKSAEYVVAARKTCLAFFVRQENNCAALVDCTHSLLFIGNLLWNSPQVSQNIPT